jgi:ABC-type sugar transport system substrate-binding protein
MAIGAALALQSQGMNPADYVIAGLDGTPDSLQFMKVGTSDRYGI